MNKFLAVIIILFFAISCQDKESKAIDVSNINATAKVVRFDQLFYNASSENLNEVKKRFPYLFPAQNNDSIWLNKIKNEQELFQQVSNKFNNFSSEQKELEQLFKHIKHYQPSFNEPKTITLITNLDYQNKIIYADSLLLVSLDMYLGSENKVYNDFPKYLSKNYNKSRLVIDVAESIASNYLIKERNREFITAIINEGKKMFLIDSYLPNKTDFEKIGYTQNEFEWAETNEAMIWKYFIENKLLFSTKTDLNERFIANAPFSKFYIDIDKESPGRIGVYLGWQIVKAFSKNNNVTLHQLLETNANEIFKKSKYKPKK
ncbi:protein involved in gliding motility GldB [Lutibacter oricola]|uniref:Protein involved in gliding motility GldB n=1 Tax=Lutibacter oricola TaxID=762486 RepID=A0A1H2TEN1_9FLAO|nr:gliding motility lipoprotein GldB [Lutibacter oricola]SDW42413.1 protein involved in gliding motility GldB [Lutibacter oricola]